MKKNQKIRARLGGVMPDVLGQLGGWFSGPGTYLWVGDHDGKCIGWIEGRPLYRLAKAIVRHMESERDR